MKLINFKNDDNKNIKKMLWNNIYSEIDNIWSESPSIDIINALNYIKSPVLDFGCGTGRNSFFLANMGYSVVGVDISNEAIKIANDKFHKYLDEISCLNFLTGDEYSDLGKFNTILCLGVFQGTSKIERHSIICELYAKLNYDGFFLVSAFSKEDPVYSILPQTKRHFYGLDVILFDKCEFINLFIDKFDLIINYERISSDNHSSPHKHKIITCIFRKTRGN